MAKTLTAPLLWAIALTMLGLAYLAIRSARARPGRQRLLAGLLLAVVLGLWAFSAPATAHWLAKNLEAPYYPAPDLSGVQAVVVLSAGILWGPAPDADHLGSATYARTVRGVRTFAQAGARWLIVSGAAPGEQPGRMAELMKDLAVTMGVPAEQVVLEPRAVDTFAHPVEVGKLPNIRRTDKLAVVTSAWHLRRAMIEFRRHFPAAVAVPAEFYSARPTAGIRGWLPGADALQVSTMLLHEYIGLWWYQVRHLAGGG